MTKRTQLETPLRLNGDVFVFLRGYTGGGAEECVHLSREVVIHRVCQKLGAGTLVFEGGQLFWEQEYTEAERLELVTARE